MELCPTDTLLGLTEDTGRADVDTVVASVAETAQELSPVEISLNGSGAFTRHAFVRVDPSPELEEVHDSVLNSLGLEKFRPYIPHLTINIDGSQEEFEFEDSFVAEHVTVFETLEHMSYRPVARIPFGRR